MRGGKLSIPTVASILRDLDAVRKRLDQAPAWLKDGKKTVSAMALCEEIQRLCRQASSSSDNVAVRASLAKATEYMYELEKILGLH